MDAPALIVMCTVPNKDVGLALARSLVGARLAACVNLVPGLTSVYRWQGAIHEDGESLLVIKTTAARLDALRLRIVAEHPYDVPEIVAIETASVHEPYLAWLVACVEPGAEDSR
ncbi:MAG: divalent-cation tolerance protein CutA [Acidobacteria bacterium]|nr:divalent-cation tolerance protein CutA [Acidobacteriota bacterium]